MVVFPVHFNQFRFEVLAYFPKDFSQGFDVFAMKNVTAVFGYEDQVRMNIENAVSASSNFS